MFSKLFSLQYLLFADSSKGYSNGLKLYQIKFKGREDVSRNEVSGIKRKEIQDYEQSMKSCFNFYIPCEISFQKCHISKT